MLQLLLAILLGQGNPATSPTTANPNEQPTVEVRTADNGGEKGPVRPTRPTRP